MERKSNKGLIVLVIILLIGVIGLGGYIVYDKVINKDNEPKTEKKVETKNEESKSLDVNSELVQSLVKLAEGYNVYGSTAVPYSDNDNEVTLKDGISDESKNTITGIQVDINSYINNNEVIDSDARRITDEGVELLKTKFEELFGYDGFGETEYGCPHYKMKDGKYYYEMNCGSVGLYSNHLVVQKVYYDGEDIIVEAKVIFVLLSGSDFRTYIITDKPLNLKSYQGDDSNINKLYEETIKDDNDEMQKMSDRLPQLMEDTAQKNIDKLNTYIHRFKKHNDKYYLYSVQKAN